MKQIKLPLVLLTGLIMSCSQSKPQGEEITPDTLSAASPLASGLPVKINTDTLQFIHFDGNGDYWDAYFLNAQKDTVRLVTDREFDLGVRDQLMKVQWKTDTLFSAGEGEAKYMDKRLIGFSPVKGKLFSRPLTENEVVRTVWELPEVKGTADNVWAGSSPTFDRPYYEIGTSTQDEDHSSMFLSFRIYTFPQYRITVVDRANGGETELDAWRKQNNP
ncbi:hypothetical protein ACS5PU_02285 [Pedobacter sp. GSP4]|uniref:hypothetical protein n=1 Tax=Pedobacter sp. GSP4 TaxID=3453716 RepID=UPI003EEE1EA8